MKYWLTLAIRLKVVAELFWVGGVGVSTAGVNPEVTTKECFVLPLHPNTSQSQKNS